MHRILFSIPIYGYSPESHEERCERHKEKTINNSIALGNSYDEALKIYIRFYSDKKEYKNYIIGYIDVLYNYQEGSIEYKHYLICRKKFFNDNKLKKEIVELKKENLTKEQYENKKNYIMNHYEYKVSRMPLFTGVKHYFTAWLIQGLHVNVSNKTNLEIAEIIKQDIENIIKNPIYKGLYIDLDQFNLLYDKINYNLIFEELHQVKRS